MYSIQARGENALKEAGTSQERTRVTGGPWGMADADGQWPLSVSHMECVIESGFQQACKEWCSKHQVPEPLDWELPPTPTSVNLFHPCPSGCCLKSLSRQQQETYSWLRAGLCALVRQRYPKARNIAANPVVLKWQSGRLQLFFVVAFSTLAWSMVPWQNQDCFLDT